MVGQLCMLDLPTAENWELVLPGVVSGLCLAGFNHWFIKVVLVSFYMALVLDLRTRIGTRTKITIARL